MAYNSQVKKVYNINKLINISEKAQTQNFILNAAKAAIPLTMYYFYRDWISKPLWLDASFEITKGMKNIDENDYYDAAINFTKAAIYYGLIDKIRTDPMIITVGTIALSAYDAYESYSKNQAKIDHLGEIKEQGYNYYDPSTDKFL